MISVLLVDDQRLIRDGFRLIINAEPDLEVVGEADSGTEAVRQAALLSPDVVLMDVRMPGGDGIEATRSIVSRGLLCRVLILTTFDVDEYVFGAFRAGPAVSCSRTRRPSALSTASDAWPPARRCWHRRRRSGSSRAN